MPTKKKVTVVRPPKAPDVKGLREVEKRTQAQMNAAQVPARMPGRADYGDYEDYGDGQGGVEEIRSHLHAALNLLDDLEAPPS
jgi:hypothetical protein